jgi:hypothetical protein
MQKFLKKFDYGPLNESAKFKDTHPEVMKEMIKNLIVKINFSILKILSTNRQLYKHEQFKHRTLTWIEQNLMRGKHISEFKNYKLVKEV